VPSGTGNPFGVATSLDGKVVFVSTDTAVQVMRVGSGGALTPAGFSYPIDGSSTAHAATSIVLSNNGRDLLVAIDNGIEVLDAHAAESGAPSARLGNLVVPGLTKYGRALNVAVTPDDRYAFVALQFAGQVGVFNMEKALKSGDFSSAYL